MSLYRSSFIAFIASAAAAVALPAAAPPSGCPKGERAAKSRGFDYCGPSPRCGAGRAPEFMKFIGVWACAPAKPKSTFKVPPPAPKPAAKPPAKPPPAPKAGQCASGEKPLKNSAGSFCLPVGGRCGAGRKLVESNYDSSVNVCITVARDPKKEKVQCPPPETWVYDPVSAYYCKPGPGNRCGPLRSLLRQEEPHSGGRMRWACN